MFDYRQWLQLVSRYHMGSLAHSLKLFSKFVSFTEQTWSILGWLAVICRHLLQRTVDFCSRWTVKTPRLCGNNCKSSNNWSYASNVNIPLKVDTLLIRIADSTCCMGLYNSIWFSPDNLDSSICCQKMVLTALHSYLGYLWQEQHRTWLTSQIVYAKVYWTVCGIG